MNEVIILGTQHRLHHSDKVYSMNTLLQIIERVKPTVLLAELSPEQLSGESTCFSKPEYPEAILPWAKASGVVVHAIQPRNSIALKDESKKLSLRDSLKGTVQWETYVKALESGSSIKVKELSILHSEGIDVLFEFLDAVHSSLFPDLGVLRAKWNEALYRRAYHVLSSLKSEKVLITIGMRHRYWFARRLRKRSDVALSSVQAYLP